MTTRDDFQAVLARNRRAMDAERREFAAQAMAAVKRNSSGETFDYVAYARTMRDLAPLFDAWYGRFPGDERARFWRLILADARQARALAFQRSVALVREKIQPARGLLAAIQREAE